MRAITYAATLVYLLTSLVIAGGQVRDRDATWRAPADQDSKLNPLANQRDALPGGQKIFRQRCATCHGDDAQGTTKAPSLCDSNVQAQTDGALFWKISGGNSHEGMPAFSFLPEVQRWQLVLALRVNSCPRRAQ